MGVVCLLCTPFAAASPGGSGAARYRLNIVAILIKFMIGGADAQGLAFRIDRASQRLGLASHTEEERCYEHVACFSIKFHARSRGVHLIFSSSRRAKHA